MPSTRALKGVANGLVETFVSRNNDVSGYWGIGMIQREMGGCPHSVVELDLLHGQAMPDGLIARELVAHYSKYLCERLTRDGFALSMVTAAKIVIEFGTFGEANAPDLFSTIGQPFNCKAILASLSGKMFCAIRGGLSRPHHPAVEHRSMRAQ